MSLDVAAVVREALRDIAPDIDAGALDPRADLRDTADMDSVDFLNLVVALHDATGVEIPESDYSRLTSVDTITAYLETALAGRASQD